MSPDPWLDYSGPLCDDPAEREPYTGEPAPRLSALGNEPDYDELRRGKP